MSISVGPAQKQFVILSRPHGASGLFTTTLSGDRIAACVFSQPHHAMLFAMNTQGLDADCMSTVDAATLRTELENEKRAGATHVILDPSAGAGTAEAVEIDDFIAKVVD